MKTPIIWRSALLLLATVASLRAAETVYFSEDFDGANPPRFECWYKAEGTQVATGITDTRAFSGKRCAFIDAPSIAYFQIPLAKPLKFDRQAPDGIGNRPLYLSARVFAERILPYADTMLGLNVSTVPKHRPSSDGGPLSGGPQDTVAGRTNQWLLLVMDVSGVLREAEERGEANPDQVVFQAISLHCYGGGRFYVDDIRLATTPPPGWTPPPLARVGADAAAYFRHDPRLEAMIFHGAYGGIGSVLGDLQLHAWVMRDMKRHYLNFAGPSFDFRWNAPERQLREFDLILDQAQQYAMPVIPMSYIGSRYAPEFSSEDQLHAAMRRIVRRYRDNPWLLAWYLEEEPGADRSAQYLKEKRWVDEEDPHHNCLMIFNARTGQDAIGPAQSVVLRDLYPIGGPNPNPWFVPQQVRQHARAFQQPFVLTDQIFTGDCCWETPTVGQFRLMNYGALAEGAKGFCHFAYNSSPTFTQKTANPMRGTMVDPYGTPSAIYEEIEHHLGPDLFSIGELLRTCRPADLPAAVTIECGRVEDALEQQLPAIALRRLLDTEGRYEIFALYNNNPNAIETGRLQWSAAWLQDRVVLDLSAQAADITRRSPVLLRDQAISVRLPAGDGRFLAVVARDQVASVLERLCAARFGAVRSMVEFDIDWLRTIERGNPQWAERCARLRRLCEQGRAGEALPQLLVLDRSIQRTIRWDFALSRVLAQLEQIRNSLSRTHQVIGRWAVFKPGQPFPGDTEPAKSYLEAQTKLGELFVGFSDLAYRLPPERLIQPLAHLRNLADEHERTVTRASANGVPTRSCATPLTVLAQLESDLQQLGWQRPLTAYELVAARSPRE